jgi:hypothetical protein
LIAKARPAMPMATKISSVAFFEPTNAVPCPAA